MNERYQATFLIVTQRYSYIVYAQLAILAYCICMFNLEICLTFQQARFWHIACGIYLTFLKLILYVRVFVVMTSMQKSIIKSCTKKKLSQKSDTLDVLEELYKTQEWQKQGSLLCFVLFCHAEISQTTALHGTLLVLLESSP